MKIPYNWKRRAVQPITVQDFTRGILILCGPLLIVIVILYLFGCSPANAQELTPTTTTTTALTTTTTVLPDSPKPYSHSVWLVEVGTLSGLYASDWTLTAKGLGKPWKPCKLPQGCVGVEENPLLGPNPSNTKITLYGASVFAGEAIVLHYTERSRHRWLRWSGRALYAYSVVDEVRSIRSWKR